MYKHLSFALLVLALSSSPLWGDSFDDAEAKRRGVPVTQVQAENALAKEKQRTAALEKQIAELKQQLADLQKAAASSSKKPPAVATATASRPAVDTASAKANMTAESALALNFDGPRASSPLYDEFVKRYLSGDWSTLAADLAAKEKEIAALPAGNLADLTYIKRTVAECRPAWWDDIKNGKSNKFTQVVFKQPVSVRFKTADDTAYKGIDATGAQPIMKLEWPNAEMDSRKPMDMMDIGMGGGGSHNFVQADALSENIWIAVGETSCYARLGVDKLEKLSPEAIVQLNRYSYFMGHVAAGYYGTPTARRLVFFSSCCSLESNLDHNDWRNARPIGAALLIDIKLHPEQYPSLFERNILYASDELKNYEYSRALYAINRLRESPVTFAEDRRLREILKNLAETNTNWDVTKIALPNKLSFDLDPEKDAPSTAERVAFLKKTEP